MIRNHVSKGSGSLVIAATLLHTHGFCCGYLHMIDVTPIPDRLKDAVAEPEHQDVLNGFFAKVMVDAVDLILVKDLHDSAIQRASGIEVAPERLFDHHASPLPILLPRQTRHTKLLNDLAEEVGSGCQIEE